MQDLPTLKVLQNLNLSDQERSILNRRYNNPKGYVPWSAASKFVVGMSQFTDTPIWTDLGEDAQAPGALCYHFCDCLGSAYWLDAGLLEALLQTDAPLGADPPNVCPTGIIMLPPVINGHFDSPIQFVVFAHQRYKRADQVRHALLLCAVDDRKYYFFRVAVDPEKGLPTTEEIMRQTAKPEAYALMWHQLASIVFQSLLVMTEEPQLIEEKAPKQFRKPQGFGMTLPNRRNPIWIGRNYKHNLTQRPSSAHGTHASPQTHWRRGHWRRVAIGPGRTQRKWNWIQPTLVNAA